MEKNNLSLPAESFSHRLNMSGFSNIEKSFTENEFSKSFPNDKYSVFEKGAISTYINNLQEKFGKEIIKGGYNDQPEIRAVIEKATKDIGSMVPVRINDGMGNNRTVYVLEKAKEVVKMDKKDFVDEHKKLVNVLEHGTKKEREEEAEEQGAEIKKGNEDELGGKTKEEIEKGVMDSFEYSSNFKFMKTGKDIKEKLKVLRTAEEVNIANLEKEIEEALLDCKTDPTEKVDTWGLRSKIKIPYKRFNWNQTYYNSDNYGRSSETKSESGVSIQPAGTPEEAACNSKYNSLVNNWVEAQVDLLTMTLYIDNLDDKKSYELSSNQMVTLGF